MDSRSRTIARPPWLFVGGIIFILLVAIHGLRGIPFWSYFGLDFQNLWLFHQCEAGRDNPYAATGADCGDPLGRDMVYPPLLYWTYVWTRIVPFPIAHALFTAFLVAGTAWATYRLSKDDLRRTAEAAPRLAPVLPWFLPLFLLQFPLAYAIERGNNDVFVLVLWAAALIALRKGRLALAGGLLGLSLALKLYPGFGLACLGLGFLAARGLKPSLRFGPSMVAAAVLPFLVFWPQTVPYATVILPKWTSSTSAIAVHAHGTLAFIGKGPGSLLLGLTLVAWTAASRARIRAGDTALALAGTLALGTWFPSVSNDYNLITAYPLLLIQFLRAARPDAPLAWRAVTLLGFVAVLGHRGWFVDWIRLHVVLQLLWLILSGALACLPWPRYESEIPQRT